MSEKMTIKIKGRNYKKPDLERLTFRQAQAMDLALEMGEDPAKAGMTAPWTILAAFVPTLPETVLHGLDLAEVLEAIDALGLMGDGEGGISMGESVAS